VEPDTGTRERLVQAAIRLFGERGYHATPVRAICAHAGVNLGAVSYHFGGKRQLYRAALRTAVETILRPGGSRPAADHLAGLLDAGTPEVRLLLHDLADGGEIALEAAAPHLRRTLERLEPAEGEGTPAASRAALARALAPLVGAALLWPVLRPGFGLGDEERRRLLDALLPFREERP